MSRDQKSTTLLPPMEKYPIDYYPEMLLLPKFDNSSPFVTRDKEICHMIMSQRHSLPPEAEYPM